MDRNRRLRLTRRAIAIIFCVVCLAAMWVVSRSPAILEWVYARGVGFQIARALSRVSGVVSFSLAEIALAGVAAYFAVPFVFASIHVLRRQRGLTNALAGGLLRVSTAAAVILVFFYLCWGLNYARAPLPARLGWTPIEASADPAERQRQIDEIRALAAELVEATNIAYREVTGSDDLGRASDRPAGAPSLDAVFDVAFARVQQRLGTEPALAAARGRAKPIAGSVLMSYLGLAGFYFPWTGEANYNRMMPAPSVPLSVAHEKAHQRGIAPEDEAGFVGYLACAMSDDPYARYSAALAAHLDLVGELMRYDLAAARTLLARRVPGVRRDLAAIRAFWEQYEGRATQVSQTVNDRYLKSQGVKAGVANYAASRNLIVLFARHNGGRAWPR